MNGGVHRSIKLYAACPGFIKSTGLSIVGDPKIFVEGRGDHPCVFIKDRSENPDISWALVGCCLRNQARSDKARQHASRLPFELRL